MKLTLSNELILRQLTTGDAEPVLVADFQDYSTAPRLSQLLSGRAEGHPVYQIDPVGVLSQDQLYVSLPELADACAQAFLSSGPPAGGRVVVVGHCSASAVSLRVARLLEQSGREATVILVGPAWPDEEHVRNRFAEFLDNLGAPQHPCPDLDGDPCDSVAQMEQVLRDELAAVALRSGLDGATDAFAELLAWYRGWLAFLLACGHELQATWQTPTAAVTVLAATVAAASVPGLGPDAYQVVTVPALAQEKPITPELAEAVLAQFASR